MRRDIGSRVHRQGRRPVAGARARVGERLACDRHELPRVAAVVQGELEDAGRAGTPDFTVWTNGPERRDLGAAGADDELPHAERRVGRARRRLRREPLVKGVMGVHDDVHACGVQHVPQRARGGVGLVLGIEQRVVPVGERALCGVGSQVALEPLHLRRRRGGRNQAVAATIQHDDVPGAERVAVVALLGISCGAAEIAEVSRGVRRLVITLARCRLGAGLVPPPRRVVAGVVLIQRAVVVRVVSIREYGSRDRVEQVGRCPGAGLATFRDVSRADERHGAGR